MKTKIKKTAFTMAESKLGDLTLGLVFGKFNKLLPINRLIDNKYVVAFWHPKPTYKRHILIVPKRVTKNLVSLKKDDLVYIDEMFKAAQKLIKSENLGEGYSLIINGGVKQKIPQLHFHLVSGEKSV